MHECARESLGLGSPEPRESIGPHVRHAGYVHEHVRPERESSASSRASSRRISASPEDRAESALTAERALKLSERTVSVAR
eukprot:6561533-Lingulodinium_polyedra.AAC.1